jgi:N-acyl-D-aspartate/D-glutamate deacylase
MLSESAAFDVVIKNGRWFDGLGSPSALRHVGIRAGRVISVSATPLDESRAQRVIDATGKWVTPGFVDAHTHYDVEVLVAPGLGESVRHGVTTVFLGNCSLSTVHASPLDCADLFSRVEAIPHEVVLPVLTQHKTWNSARDYLKHLESLPLGPDVATFLGHSDIRAAVMGLDRATDPRATPDKRELRELEVLLDQALDAGFIGLSSMANRWDKLDGDRYWSRPLPSTFAKPAELRRLTRVLRRRRRVLQSAPSLANPWTAVQMFFASMGWLCRVPLRISLLTAADGKALPWLTRVLTTVTRLFNRWLGTDIRWQHLPVPFEVYADGIDLVVFEEFGAGRAARHVKDQVERNRLLLDESYRRQFRRDYATKLTPRVWQRDFHDAFIVACPEPELIGLSFGQVAEQRGIHPVDAYLDLVVQHGDALRWHTVIANHREHILNELSNDPCVHMGFADSGAHLRNMAFYNFPIRLLRRVQQAARAGHPFMTPERAIYRLSGELAGWFGLDAGTLREGDRANIAIIDPEGLDASVDAYEERSVAEYNGFRRMVNRSDAALTTTLIGGQVVYEAGQFVDGYGTRLRTGSVLKAGRRSEAEWAA